MIGVLLEGSEGAGASGNALMGRIERVIISCHDKTGVVDLARVLRDFSVEIISTEGTQRVLQEAGIESKEIADFTGTRELLSGRVKSLHPKVHAGLLGVRDNKLHQEEMRTYEYAWVDMLVVNVHPLEELIATPAITPDEVVDQVDIGGVAMIRSAAKNFRYVTVVVNPDRYSSVAHEIQAHEGKVPFTMRFRLAQEAFSVTAAYDRDLAEYLQRCEPPEE